MRLPTEPSKFLFGRFESVLTSWSHEGIAATPHEWIVCAGQTGLDVRSSGIQWSPFFCIARMLVIPIGPLSAYSPRLAPYLYRVSCGA